MNIKELEKFTSDKLQLILNIQRIKNREYSNENDLYKVFDKIAILEERNIEDVIKTLINVKVCRLNNNSKEDTFLDLVNYVMLLWAYFENGEDQNEY
jgi:hypothetical protein